MKTTTRATGNRTIRINGIVSVFVNGVQRDAVVIATFTGKSAFGFTNEQGDTICSINVGVDGDATGYTCIWNVSVAAIGGVRKTTRTNAVARCTYPSPGPIPGYASAAYRKSAAEFVSAQRAAFATLA
jgi:hypothetical protein